MVGLWTVPVNIPTRVSLINKSLQSFVCQLRLCVYTTNVVKAVKYNKHKIN